ncbi:hypothetical protein ACFE04_003097 [Oxalis oulophora]
MPRHIPSNKIKKDSDWTDNRDRHWSERCPDVESMYGTRVKKRHHQIRPLRRLIGLRDLFSYDLSSATDRFPLSFQETLVERLKKKTLSFSFIQSEGLGCNVFLSPTSRSPMVWLAADRVYPETLFWKYALLGDDIGIGDQKVASVYREMMAELGVKISLPESLVSSRGSMEFAKRFFVGSRNLSPEKVQMILAARFSVASMAVLNHIGCQNPAVSMRLRRAGYRKY